MATKKKTSSETTATKGTASAEPAPMISVRDLRRTYKLGRVELEVLKGVSLDIARGEFSVLLGHSGSGKSTLLHLIGLLDKPSTGEITIDGVNIAEISARAKNQIRCREIGFVFQFYHLLPELTVLENTYLPAMIDQSIWTWPGQKKAFRDRAGDLLKELGLSERLKHRPRELSGGERQRVAIARALIHQPKLLLADEPTGNLDSKTGETIMELLLRWHKQHNQTILMVTHDEDLAALASRTLTLRDGRLVRSLHPKK